MSKALIVTEIIFFLIFTALLLGQVTMKLRLAKNVKNLFTLSPATSNYVSEEAIKKLPPPVQRYIKYALPENPTNINYVRLKHNGSFRLKPSAKWLPINGEEYFTTTKIGFVWFGQLPLFSVIDQYVDGQGSLIAKLLSVLTVVKDSGEKIDQGELLRWLGESPWYPAALLSSPHIKWEEINDHSVKAIVSDRKVTAEAVFYFNDRGEVTKLTALRYKETSLEKWTGYYQNYQTINGVKVPLTVEVVWNLKSGDFSYAKFNVTEIQFNKPYQYKK